MVWYGIDLFEFGISTVHCTTWEDAVNNIDVRQFSVCSEINQLQVSGVSTRHI